MESERVQNFFNLCNQDKDFTKEELFELGKLMLLQILDVYINHYSIPFIQVD